MRNALRPTYVAKEILSRKMEPYTEKALEGEVNERNKTNEARAYYAYGCILEVLSAP